MGRCVKSCFEREASALAVGAQKGFGKSTGAAFAFRAGYVDYVQIVDIGVLDEVGVVSRAWSTRVVVLEAEVPSGLAAVARLTYQRCQAFPVDLECRSLSRV